MRHWLPTLALLVSSALAAQPSPEPAGGGPAPGLDVPTDELSDLQRAAIQSRLGATRARLEAQGALSRSATAPALSWPLRYADDVGDVHVVTNFVDVDPRNPGFVRDYACNARSYDQSGYDHSGVDYSVWPFMWELMDRGAVEVVAAAPGTLIGVDDGQPDRTCSWQGAGDWNAVYVQHDDGSVAWYGHLQRGSATTQAVGSRVERGAVLGRVGSSGRSTGPHLHFEVHDANGAVVEPHQGACNTAGSWWMDQRPYYDSAINAIATHQAPPAFATCPSTTDASNRSDRFDPGDRVYFAAYFRDQRAGQPADYTVTTPSGAPFARWTHAMTQAHFAASYWYWWYALPASAEEGVWTLTVQFEGETRTHAFAVGQPTPAEPGPAAGLAVSRPHPNPAVGTVRLGVTVDRVRTVQVAVYDVLGREVARPYDGPLGPGAGALSLDVSALPGGAYVVRVESEGRVVSHPLVVAR